MPLRAAPAGRGPTNIHVMRVSSSRPLHERARSSRTVTRYAWKCPAAQYGVQSFWCAVADAAAVAPHVVHFSPST
ncbi:MAG: hypothetical protein JO186_06520 [Actinobacteria bacterium]|nr:hypothetical protein [Actinomycetota bacterium]